MKSHIKIYEIAVSRDSSFIGLADFNGKIHLWNLDTVGKIGNIRTVYDFGGQRLALSHDGKKCFAASYQKEILACYTIPNGNIQWQHANIRGIQKIVVSKDGQKAYCEVDSKSFLSFDINTGGSLPVYQKAKDIHESIYDDVYLLEKDNLELWCCDEKLAFSIDRVSFAILSVCFGKGLFCISESGSIVRCFEISNGNEAWRYNPPSGSHVLELGYMKKENAFVGVEWPYEKGGRMKLIRFDKNTGRPSLIREFESVAGLKFTPSGDHLLTSEGHLININNGIVDIKIPI